MFLQVLLNQLAFPHSIHQSFLKMQVPPSQTYARSCRGDPSGRPYIYIAGLTDLEQSRHLAGLDIHIYLLKAGSEPVPGIRLIVAGHRAEELGAGVDQDIADGQRPALGHALEGRVMGQAERWVLTIMVA